MNWFRPKTKEHIKVNCTSCHHSQMVAEGITATFCEKCNKTIYVDKPGGSNATTNTKGGGTTKGDIPQDPKLQKKTSSAQPPPEIKASVSSVPVSETTPSVSATPGTDTDNKAPFPGEGSKKVRCPYCRAIEEVPNIAIQSFCGSCGQRIHLQDYHIRGRFHGDLETRGEVCITPNADVSANLNVGRATIQGRIKGEILTEHVTVIANGGFLLGKVVSPSLVVHEGGGFVGEAIIGEPNK